MGIIFYTVNPTSDITKLKKYNQMEEADFKWKTGLTVEKLM